MRTYRSLACCNHPDDGHGSLIEAVALQADFGTKPVGCDRRRAGPGSEKAAQRTTGASGPRACVINGDVPANRGTTETQAMNDYDADVLLWSERQADLLRRLAAGERVNDQVDWENVIEEVESVGSEQLHSVE